MYSGSRKSDNAPFEVTLLYHYIKSGIFLKNEIILFCHINAIFPFCKYLCICSMYSRVPATLPLWDPFQMFLLKGRENGNEVRQFFGILSLCLIFSTFFTRDKTLSHFSKSYTFTCLSFKQTAIFWFVWSFETFLVWANE